MRKMLSILLIFALIFALTGTAFASNDKNNKVTEKKEIQEYSWFYKGIQFTVVTDHKISTTEKSEFEKIFDEKNEEIIINYIPIDGGAIVVGGPMYHTFDNTIEKDVVRYLVDIVGLYVAGKVGATIWGAISIGTADYFTLKMEEATPDYTYWGFWQTKAYSDYYGYYQYFNTDVRYANSDYTSAIEVYYYDTNYHE